MENFSKRSLIGGYYMSASAGTHVQLCSNLFVRGFKHSALDNSVFIHWNATVLVVYVGDIAWDKETDNTSKAIDGW